MTTTVNATLPQDDTYVKMVEYATFHVFFYSECNKNFASCLKLAKYIFRGISIMWKNLYFKKLHRRKV